MIDLESNKLRDLNQTIVESQQGQGIVIDWNETRLTDNYLSLFVGEYSKLYLVEGRKVEIKLEDPDGFLIEKNGELGLRYRTFAIIKSKVSEKINKAMRSGTQNQLVQRANYLVNNVLEDAYDFLTES